MDYIPKGGMCATCVERESDCSQLPFDTMPIIRVDDDVKVVRCTHHHKAPVPKMGEVANAN